MSAIAEEVASADLERSLAIYNGRLVNPAERGVSTISLDDVSASAPYRLYRAIASEHWILDPNAHPDRRAPVTMAALT